ncbi:MAG: hypothetical protein EOS34_20555 [Mesorhizobium sp.]|nr:MAG: hypothetical protein EOS34_20555 [Mesorhizobium sp.]
MRDAPAWHCGTPSNTPLPSRRCAPIHLLPQGEKAEHSLNALRTRSRFSPARPGPPASDVRRGPAGR